MHSLLRRVRVCIFQGSKYFLFAKATILLYFEGSYVIGVAISRFNTDSMLSTKGSKAPGSFIDSRLYEQTVELAWQ
jgi:hypothetical protein